MAAICVLLCYWNNHLSTTITPLLDIPVCVGTTENLFNHIDSALEKMEFLGQTVVLFASDTTKVIVGKHNLVISRITGKQTKVYSQGCVYHFANLSLLAGLKCLPIDADDFLVDF